METFTRFRGLRATSRYFSTTHSVNSEWSFKMASSFLRVREFKIPGNITEIPDFPKLWTKYASIKIAENNCKRLLLNEFFSETQIKKDNQPENFFEKIVILQSSIEVLMKHNLVQSLDTLLNELLSQLEPFPFNSKLLLSDTRQNVCHLTIQEIRNIIEKYYLAWKFDVQLKDIEQILYRYRLCLFEFRSLGNLKRNVDMLEKLSRTYNPCVAEKIYHINQKPFNIDSVLNFRDTLAGLNWQVFPQYCPKILCNSHQYILFVISVLRGMNFTEKQIQEGLPFLHFAFHIFAHRLNNLLVTPEIAKYREENNFLHLLSYTVGVLKDLISLRKATFTELTEMIGISSEKMTPSIRFLGAKSILYHLNQFYAVDDSCLKTLKRHSKYKLVSEAQILDTLEFLKSKDFQEKEIAESVTVILYPRNALEKCLEKIESEEENLQKYGLQCGFTSTNTDNFESGTKEKRKTLQLCLYYMEKPFNFSGDGIWGFNGD